MVEDNEKKLFAIRCESESGIIISSQLEFEAWNSIQSLVEFLKRDKYPSVNKALFSWRNRRNHLAEARETYAWRDVIDSIKASDLSKINKDLQRVDVTSVALIKSKPIMLRMAGEITNALLHSYSNRHRITFFQCDSREPS